MLCYILYFYSMDFMKCLFWLLVTVLLFGLGASSWAGTLTDVSVVADDYTAGAVTNYILTYTTETDIQWVYLEVNEMIFNWNTANWNNFGLTDVTVSVTASDIEQTVDEFWNWDGPYIRLWETVTGWSVVVVTFSGVVNPSIPWVYALNFSTANNWAVTIDEPLTPPQVTITGMPDWVLPYSGDSVTPVGFVRIVDDIFSPQWMVYMRQYPIGSDEYNPFGHAAYDYASMQGYVPLSGEAIPSTALKDLLVTSNGTTTRVADGTMYDYGNWSNWVSDPLDAGGWLYHLMSVQWSDSQAWNYLITAMSDSAKIRTIYTSYYIPPDTSLTGHISRCDTNSGSINIPYQECVWLAYLYEETNGDYWNNNSGWFENFDVTTWEASDCSTNGEEYIGDVCSGTWMFNGDGFDRAVALTGDGPIKNVYALNLTENDLEGSIASWFVYFSQLYYVSLYDNYDLTGVSFSWNPLLEFIHIWDNNDDDPRVVDFSSNPLLRFLYADDLSIETIDLSANTALVHVDLDGNKLTEFNTTGLVNLQYLDLGDENSLTSFVSYAPNLLSLDIAENNLETIDVSNSPLLENLELGDNNIQSIDLNNNTALIYLDIDWNQLSHIDLSVNTSLVDINLYYNVLQTIDFPDPSLYEITSPYIDVDINAICNPTAAMITILDLYADNWADDQFFCPVNNLAVSVEWSEAEITRNTPYEQYGSTWYSEYIIWYEISWIGWSIGRDGILVEEPIWENENHDWSFTITGINSNDHYTFTVCAVHASEWPNMTVCSDVLYNEGDEEEVPVVSWIWWGNSPLVDFCPDGDFSWSYYDDMCGDIQTNESLDVQSSDDVDTEEFVGQSDSPTAWSTEPVSCSQAYESAYAFAYQYNITTMPSCLEADMDGYLSRIEAAKMLSNYAINVLWKTSDNNKECVFSDMIDWSTEAQMYAIASCRLGIMWLEPDGMTPAQVFNPSILVDKAQFATMLSRLMDGPLYDNNDGKNRRVWHVDALVEQWVIKITSDLFNPLKRAFAMMMLQRTQE